MYAKRVKECRLMSFISKKICIPILYNLKLLLKLKKLFDLHFFFDLQMFVKCLKQVNIYLFN